MLTIRNANLADLGDVYHLVCDLEGETLNPQIFAQTYSESLKEKNVHYFVACDGDRIVGFLSMHIQRILHHERQTCELQELNVLPDYRSQGIGTMLMNHAESLARELGLEEIELTTRLYRTRAQEFYKRLGYSTTHFKFVKKI